MGLAAYFRFPPGEEDLNITELDLEVEIIPAAVDQNSRGRILNSGSDFRAEISNGKECA